MKTKTSKYTWQKLNMISIDQGILRLKYPRCKIFVQHLLNTHTLRHGLKRAAIHLKQTYGYNIKVASELIRYCTLDSVPLDSLLKLTLKLTSQKQKIPQKKPVLKCEDIKKICQTVMSKLGPFHTEQTYELALSQELYNRDIAHTRQIPISTKYDKHTTIPTGIIDMEIDHKFLLELKIGKYHTRHAQQLNRYISSLRSHGRSNVCGLLVFFDDNGTVMFHTV